LIKQKKIVQHRFLLRGSLIAAAWVIIAPAWLVIDLRLRYAVKIAAPLIKIALAGSLELSRLAAHLEGGLDQACRCSLRNRARAATGSGGQRRTSSSHSLCR
jgi:hypothetical protein